MVCGCCGCCGCAEAFGSGPLWKEYGSAMSSPRHEYALARELGLGTGRQVCTRRMAEALFELDGEDLGRGHRVGAEVVSCANRAAHPGTAGRDARSLRRLLRVLGHRR